jgi:hypothetical protein
MQQALQPLVAAMEGAAAAERRALDAMRAAEGQARAAMQPAVTIMQQAVAAVSPVVTAMQGAIAAEQRALTAMQPGKQGDIAADGQARELIPGDGGGVLQQLAPGAGTEGKFFSQLQGVPIDFLIATPLISSARANLAMASVLAEFIDEIGFVDDKKTTRLIKFNLTRPVKDMSAATPDLKAQTIQIEAPLLALVPLPALLIDTVTVDLTVEIQQKTQQKTTDNRSTELKIGGQYWFASANFTGSYSLKQEDTRDTNQTAKYNVRVAARQQPLPEGMSKLMDVFVSTIEPIEIGTLNKITPTPSPSPSPTPSPTPTG